MAIYFVRHGQTVYNVKGVYYGSLDACLTETGVEQAKAVGAMLKDLKPDRVIVSDLQRTQQTAREILKAMQISEDVMEVHPEFNEMHFGAWEGKHYTEVRDLFPEDYEAMSRDWIRCGPTGGERFEDFYHRILKAWKELQFTDSEQILFVGHGGPMQCIFSHLLHMGAENIWHLEIMQGAYTKFKLVNGFPVLQGFNLKRGDQSE